MSAAYGAPSLDEDLNVRLAKIAAKIRREANGRTCSSCQHIRNGWCASQMNIHGDNLAVLHPNAVACGQFEVQA